MDNEKISADNRTPIQYLLRKNEAHTTTAYLPAGFIRLEVQALQVPLEISAYNAKNKDFYLNIFQSTNVSVLGPYAKKFSRTKDVCKAYFAISQHFMGDNAINREKEKACSEMEADKYRGESQRFTYETYVIIFEKDMRILSRNNEEMWDAGAVHKFLSGIECPWYAAGKYFVTGSDDHKNYFAKKTAYLASFVQHGNIGDQKIYAFHAQGSGGGRYRGCFGRGVRGRGGYNDIGGQYRHGGSGVRGTKPYISAISYTDQE